MQTGGAAQWTRGPHLASRVREEGVESPAGSFAAASELRLGGVHHPWVVLVWP